MTVMARKEGSAYLVLTKGAPEVLTERIGNFGEEVSQEQYVRAYKDLMRAGKRVLTVAWRTLESEGGSETVFNLERDLVERDLQFAGFLVMTCPMKKDTRQELEILRAAHHQLVMITGDNVLTAAHVAKTLELNKPAKAATECSNPLFMGLGASQSSCSLF